MRAGTQHTPKSKQHLVLLQPFTKNKHIIQTGLGNLDFKCRHSGAITHNNHCAKYYIEALELTSLLQHHF